MVILISGPPGVGKTTVGQLVAGALDVPYIDADQGRFWQPAIARAEQGRPAVIQHGPGCPVTGDFIVELMASDDVRWGRLMARGDSRRLKEKMARGRPDVKADLVIDTNGLTPEQIADRILEETCSRTAS